LRRAHIIGSLSRHLPAPTFATSLKQQKRRHGCGMRHSSFPRARTALPGLGAPAFLLLLLSILANGYVHRTTYEPLRGQLSAGNVLDLTGVSCPSLPPFLLSSTGLRETTHLPPPLCAIGSFFGFLSGGELQFLMDCVRA
jgi:hypothetical protein